MSALFDVRAVSELVEALAESGIAYSVDDYGEIHVERGPFRVRIAPRNYYCDRGRWLMHDESLPVELGAVHAESVDTTIACVDGQDMFPRYFLHADTLVKEVSMWLDVRMANLRAKT